MGMDVFGKNENSETGRHFRNSWWYWRPLADFLHDIAPDIVNGPCATTDCPDGIIYWQNNDGCGLDDEQSKLLSQTLRSAISEGGIFKWGRAHGKEVREACEVCDGAPHFVIEEHYVLCGGNIVNFMDFLDACGGFELY